MSQYHSEIKDEVEVENILTAVEPEIKIPLAIEWIINNFQVLNKIEYLGKDYPLAVYPQFEYYFTIYYEADENLIKVELGFHNTLRYSNYKIQIDCNVILGKSDDTKETINISETLICPPADDEFNNIVFLECSLEEWMNKYAETLQFIKLKGIFNIQKIFTRPLIICQEFKEQLRYEKLYEDIIGRDFVIVLAENELKVHKSILQENSSVFATMLESEYWKETKEGKIEIKDFQIKHVKIAIEALYCIKYEQQLNIHDYLELYRFTDKYDMENLKKVVIECIILTPNNVCRYANLFLSKDLQELIDYCIDFLIVCSQYSLPIQNMEELDINIKNQFFERVFISPLQKRNVENENTNDIGQYKYIEC